MQVLLRIISAFTHNGKGGNLAGVVFDADRFTPVQMQAIAAKAGLNETAFISRSSIADYKLDFFTPVRRIAHCGHATIATFSYLRQTGVLLADHSSKETVDGRREIRFIDGLPFMEQTAPLYQPQTGEEGAAIIASLGGLGADPVIVNTGNAFAVIRVDSQQQLRDLQPQVDSITAISERHGLIGYYVFTTAADAPYDATTRMFAPAYGIPEEPATGTAAGTLAGYLFRYDQAKRSYLFQQGAFMASPAPSEIKAVLNTEGDKIQNIYVGGDATLIDTIKIDI